MQASALHLKVIKEIELIPDDSLLKLYDFIHFFRIGLETIQTPPEDIMQFAGCWRDMSDQDLTEFLEEITVRRQHSFSGRIQRETIIN